MPIPSNDRKKILQLFEALSEGEASTIIASLKEENSQIGTSVHSKNYQFLTQLVRMGLAREKPLDIDLPTVTSFSINNSAKSEISSLIESLSTNSPT